MTRALSLAAVVAAWGFLLAQTSAPSPQDELPPLGERLDPLPAGPLKGVGDQACLNCHSADIIRQQRLTEKQWAANVDKMIGWGAAVPEDRKNALVAYLFEHFGPDNDRFRPVLTRPSGR